MQTLNHNVKWQVSLSTGETFFEDKGDFIEIPDQLSPWQRLQKYLIENEAQITSLSLYTNDGQSFNLPSAGKNPKFKAFSDLEKPLDYQMFRTIGRNVAGLKNGVVVPLNEHGFDDWFTVIEAIYSFGSLQLWVDENNSKNSWVLFKNKVE